MTMFRIVFEILGVATFFACHYVIVLFAFLGSTLRGVPVIGYWATIASGYLVMVLVAVLRRRVFDRTPRRQLFDTWLLAWPIAVVLAWTLLELRWPLSFKGWDGHGMGASGGEANAVFVPWLHVVTWVLLARLWPVRSLPTPASMTSTETP